MHQVCTSFGKINHTVTANDFHTAEHGVSLKLNAFRIGKTCLILTRSGNNVSIGLLSLKFIADAGLNYIVAPVVSYEVLNDEVFKSHTPFPEHITSLILKYCKPLFASEYDLKWYVLNNMKRDGTEIFLMNLRNPNKNL